MSTGFEPEVYDVRVKLLQPMLGTAPASKSIWSEHIRNTAKKGMQKTTDLSEEEIEAKLDEEFDDLPEIESRGKTTFLKDERGFYVPAYFIKGYYKTAGKLLKQCGNLKQLRSKVVNYLYVRPDKVYVAEPNETLEIIERPLRASTPMGERTSIARSDAIPAGREFSYQIHILAEIPYSCVKALHELSTYQGFGQWRTSGHGSFEVIECVKQG